MKRGRYFARLALQSGVAIRSAPRADGMGATRAAEPTEIEEVSERIVSPAPPPAALTPRPRASAESIATAPRDGKAPVTPVSPPAAPEHRRGPAEDSHPAVRIGEARPLPGVRVSDVPLPRERIDAPLPVQIAPTRSAHAIDEEVFVTASDPVAPIEVRASDTPTLHPPALHTPPVDRPPVPPPARFARALAEARHWVSATPAPGEITHTAMAVAPAEEVSVPAPGVVVREEIVAAAPAAPAMQELRVSIGRIEVIIDDAPAPVVPARTAAPIAPSNAPPAMRRLSRHYLRG